MIKGLSSGVGVKVSGGDTSVPYISMTNENPIQGMVRVWGSDLQVFDHTSWKTLPSSYATITLDEYALDLLDWARKKKNEEEFMSKHEHPAMQAAYANLQKVRQQLEATAILVKED